MPLSREIQDRVGEHPCFSRGAHFQYGRLHLPVAPSCNIQCAYCDRRFDCPNESQNRRFSGWNKRSAKRRSCG